MKIDFYNHLCKEEARLEELLKNVRVLKQEYAPDFNKLEKSIEKVAESFVSNSIGLGYTKYPHRIEECINKKQETFVALAAIGKGTYSDVGASLHNLKPQYPIEKAITTVRPYLSGLANEKDAVVGSRVISKGGMVEYFIK